MASAAMAGATAITIITGIGMATGATGTTITTGRVGTITITATTIGVGTGITTTTATIVTGITATAGKRLSPKRPPVSGPAGVFTRGRGIRAARSAPAARPLPDARSRRNNGRDRLAATGPAP